MNRKAQIFSLDFLFSLAIMVLVIGFILMFLDLSLAAQKDEMIWTELKETGNTASNLLVGNPKITCDLVDVSGDKIMEMPNCVNKSASFSRTDLGIPSASEGYQCRITIGSWVAPACNTSPPSSASNIYSTQRIVISSNGDVRKDSIPSNHEIAEIKVWRSLA